MGDKIFKQLNFKILGNANQVLNVVLFPGQALYVPDTQIICCSDGLKKLAVKRPLCEESKEYTPFHWKFANESKQIEYLTINNKGGSIIALNSLLMKNMLLREDYILAHTTNVSLKKWK